MKVIGEYEYLPIHLEAGMCAFWTPLGWCLYIVVPYRGNRDKSMMLLSNGSVR